MHSEIKSKIAHLNLSFIGLLECKVNLGTPFCQQTGCSNIAHCNPVKIWLCWSPTINVKILEESSQHVHCRISHFDNCYDVAGCYGAISVQDRQQLWNNLNLIASSSNSPWLVLGDFNAVRWEQEKSGRAKPNLVSMESFNNCLGSCALEDSHL